MKIQALIEVGVSGYTGQRDAFEDGTRDCIVELDDTTKVSLVIDPHTKQRVTFDFCELQRAFNTLRRV